MGPARGPARRIRSTVLAALVGASAALIGAVIYQSLASPSSSAASSIDIPLGAPGDHHGSPAAALPEPPRQERSPGRATRSGVALAGGVVPAGVSIFDDEFPAVANLDPDLLEALRRAATAAADDGVEFLVNSGWRSPKYQNQLLRAAVAEYGSEEEAARWVATPDTSAHVSGDAVDIGPAAATAWLSRHGARYELCQIYRNEPWHYELRPGAIEHGCPPMYADPTGDPRMQR